MPEPLCPICHDQAIVELVGTHPDGNSRGAAPCKWCDAGKKLYAKLATQKHHPLSDYSPNSLASPPLQSRYRLSTKEEALNEWNHCIHTWRELGPPQARAWAKDSLQWRVCTRCQKEEAVQVPLEPNHSRLHFF